MSAPRPAAREGDAPALAERSPSNRGPSSRGPSDHAPSDHDVLTARLWRYFRTRGIRFCVLGAPGTGLGGDIDMVIAHPRGRELLREIDGFARDNGVAVVQALQHEWPAWYFVLAWRGDDGAPRYLQPDICADYLREARRVLAAEELLAEVREARDRAGRPLGYPVPAPATAFAYYVVKKIAKGELTDRHGAWLAETWQRDPDGARAALARFWPEDEAALIARAAETGDWSELRGALPRLRRDLVRRLPRSPAARAREGLRRLRRILRPAGLTVAVLGPDGAGKTTLIERLIPILAPAFRRSRRFHLRPQLIARGRAAGPVENPHAEPARGAAASAAKVALFALDFLLGHAVRIWPLKLRSTLVVFDRHYHDLLADPARYRYGAPRWVASLGALFVPRPDLWIVLDAPPATVQARKSEVGEAETARQRAAYRALARRLGPAAVVVDADQPPDRVAADAAGAVLDHLAARFARRLDPGFARTAAPELDRDADWSPGQPLD